MYYTTNSNGDIVPVDTVEQLPNEFQHLPQTPPPYDELSGSVSGGDVVVVQSVSDDYLSVQQFQEGISTVNDAIERSNVRFPSDSYVNLCQRILSNCPPATPYWLVGSENGQSVTLYYGEVGSGSSSRSVLYISAPVTICEISTDYYNGSYHYDYNVSHSNSTQSINLGSTLVYTNLKEGYPDIAPMEKSIMDNLSPYLIFAILAVLVMSFFRQGGKKR